MEETLLEIALLELEITEELLLELEMIDELLLLIILDELDEEIELEAGAAIVVILKSSETPPMFNVA